LSVPRPEFPRPDFERKDWLNLNGEWEFEVDGGKSGFEKGWSSGKDFSRRILVPFPPESSLSGIEEKDFMESVWYRRFFDIPDSWLDGEVLLRFGAVDYEARVFVNGCEVGHHIGGFTPFTCNISGVVKSCGNELVVWARDECRSGLQPTGKQSHRLESFACLYSRVTGIWQTVWLESAPNVYLRSFQVSTDPYNGKALVRANVEGGKGRFDLSLEVYDGNKLVFEDTGFFFDSFAQMMLTIPNAREWSPEEPVLYDLRFRLTDGDGVVDRVSSYLGLREVHVVGNKILFNNKTRFLRLVLDQGYYPDGIYTAPSDEALRKDIEISKEMGFDGARLHQKVFEPRFLYWADKLGYLVTGEFADWGVEVELSKDKAREAFLDEWVEVLQRDINHPSIIIWTPLNERVFREGDSSIEFLENIFNVTKFVDPSRPVIDTSGYTHVKTEIYDIHDYEQDIKKFLSHYKISELDYDTAFKWRKFQNYQQNIPYTGSPIFVSEYGGIWWHPEKKEEKSWGYGEKPKSLQEFTDRYMSLTNILLSNSNICGFCYTQLYDIEQETNGLYNYDRKRKINPEIILKINQQKSTIEKENN
jgi:beta-galactosidase/beta-glucuronidase